MPKFWKITNRSLENGVPSGTKQGGLTYWVSDGGPLDQAGSWTKVSAGSFKTLLVDAVEKFPALIHDNHEAQMHVVFFIHGYNNGWDDAGRRYERLCGDLFSGPDGLGICIS